MSSRTPEGAARPWFNFTLAAIAPVLGLSAASTQEDE